MQSLVVSLPLPSTGLLHHKPSMPENRNIETGSVDSMRQELCYFKPIEGNTPTRYSYYYLDGFMHNHCSCILSTNIGWYSTYILF